MQRFSFADFFSRSSDFLKEGSPLDVVLARFPALSVEGPWLAGGSLRRTLLHSPLDSDFDFFFASEDQFKSFDAALKAKGCQVLYSNEHNVTYRMESVNSKSVGEDEFSDPSPELKIQAIIIRWYSSLDDVLDSFDFTICQFGYDGVDLVCGDYALWDLGRRRLVPHKITFGTASVRRLLKYTSQGFTLCAGSATSFLEQVAANPSSIQSDIKYID